MDSTDRPVQQLRVRVKNHPDYTLSVDFWSRDRLAAQLARFEERRGSGRARRGEDLHTFSNGRGETISFSDDLYLGHDVVELPAPETPTDRATSANARVRRPERVGIR